MKKKWRIALFAATVAGLALSGWAGASAAAASEPSHVSVDAPLQTKSWASHRKGAFEIESSIKLPREAIIKARQAGRDAYTAVLAPYAKVPVGAAERAALAKYPGAAVQDIGLQAVRHNLVYIALLSRADMRHLVVIDAGNGRVLSTRDFRVRHGHHDKHEM